MALAEEQGGAALQERESPEAPGQGPAPEKAPGTKSPSGEEGKPPARKKPPAKGKRKRRSPVPASMWLLPSFRLPFSTPGEFAQWFLSGINFWAVGAVALCALAGWLLIGWLGQPRLLGAEQALAGAGATAGLTYTVERAGEREAVVTGTWNREKGQEEPGPELAAALCAALSPEEIYGHSDHLYRAIAREFFDGEDFDLTIVIRDATPAEKGEEDREPPAPVFSVTRRAGAEDWPEPECPDPAFAQAWREAYSQYWLFGQGRKEEMGPPQSDPIIEEGDLPPESSGEEEDGPPLPDLEGEDGPEGEPDSGESGEPGEDRPESSQPPDASSGGSSGGTDGEAPEGDSILDRLLAFASEYRDLTWKEAWERFWNR